MNNHNQIKIDSHLSEVKTLAGHFRQFCARNNLSEETSSILELALVEAINNIIIHAYEKMSGNIIKAQYQKSDTKIIITLTDYGKPFEKKEKNRETNQNDIDALPEGNWGIDLIESIVDEIHRHRENDKNMLTIIKNRR